MCKIVKILIFLIIFALRLPAETKYTGGGRWFDFKLFNFYYGTNNTLDWEVMGIDFGWGGKRSFHPGVGIGLIPLEYVQVLNETDSSVLYTSNDFTVYQKEWKPTYKGTIYLVPRLNFIFPLRDIDATMQYYSLLYFSPYFGFISGPGDYNNLLGVKMGITTSSLLVTKDGLRPMFIGFELRYTKIKVKHLDQAKEIFSIGIKMEYALWRPTSVRKVREPELITRSSSTKSRASKGNKESGYTSTIRPKYPPDLVVSDVKFKEPSGNNILDAEEDGEVSFLIENQGKGKAYDVRVKVLKLEGGEGIKYPKEVYVGDIKPNYSKRVKIKIKGTKKTVDGVTKLRIETSERFGFDAVPILISFSTKRLLMPDLFIADAGIDDDKEGDSYGDNDGVIELGEAVEVSLAIHNKGEGIARNTMVSLSLPYEGRGLFYNSVSKVFKLGNIYPGDSKVIKFCFMTNKRYSEDRIPIILDVRSVTGDYTKKDSIIFPVGVPSSYQKEIFIAQKPQNEVKVQRKVQLSVDVDNVPEVARRENPDAIAVIIGIEEYKYAPPATYANRDAIIFYEYAKKVLGIPERNIYIRTNEDATKGEFDKIFATNGWLARKVKKHKSIVYVYYSGHGAPDIETHKPYIIPYDIDPNYASAGFPLKKLYSSLSALEAKSVVVFLDACFSGVSRGDEMLFANARPLAVKPITENIPEDLAIFSASSETQIASSYPEKKHGLFTYYLLKGFRGKGDLNGDGEITAGELSIYIKEKVEEKAREMDREQTPIFKGNPNLVIIK